MILEFIIENNKKKLANASFFLLKALLNDIVVFLYSVDFRCSRSTPTGEPAGAKRRRGSPARPRKSELLQRRLTAKFNRALLKIRPINLILC